jgi:Trypsin
VLDEPVDLVEYGQVTDEGSLDRFAKSGKNSALFDTVGYGLIRSRPTGDIASDIRMRATPKLIDLKGMFSLPEGTAAKFSNDNGKTHQGGTCSGDSGGPFLYGGTNEIVAVNSFGINGNCTGTDGAYRIDQEDDLDFLAEFSITPS